MRKICALDEAHTAPFSLYSKMLKGIGLYDRPINIGNFVYDSNLKDRVELGHRVKRFYWDRVGFPANYCTPILALIQSYRGINE